MAGMVYGAVTREGVRSLGKRQLTRREGWDWVGWGGNCRQTAEICQAMDVETEKCVIIGTRRIWHSGSRGVKIKIIVGQTRCAETAAR